MAVVKNPLESRLKKLEAELKALKKVKRPQDGIKVKPELLAAARRPIRAAKHRVADSSIFHPYAGFPREAMPPEAADRMTMAVDSAGFGFGGGGGGGFGQQALWSAYAEGQEFLGYPTLALMAQRGEYRTIVRTLASAMTRKWIRIKSGKDDGSSQPKINQLDNFMKKLRVRQHFKRAAELDFYFGRGHLFLEFGGTKVGTDPAETQHSVGWGDDEVTRDKVGKQCRLTAIRPVEPVWTYPMSYNTNDPLSPNWYKPEDWFVMGKRVHGTRLLRFVMDEVSDLLKPAYSFGGLSKLQIAKPYVDNWLSARQSVADILKGFTTYVLSTNLLATLRNGSAQDLYERIDVFVNTRDNSGVMAIDKNGEAFNNVSVPLGGLDRLQSQSLEFICCVSQLPLVYFTGITPSGLNPSSRDEMLVFNETIKSMQEVEFEDNLRTVFHHCQMSLWGEVDDDLDFEFLPLIEMTELERSQKQLVDAQVEQAYVEMQAVQPNDIRSKLAEDPNSPFPGLATEGDDPDDQAEPDKEDPWQRWVRLGSASEEDPFEKLRALAGVSGEPKDEGPWSKLAEVFAQDEDEEVSSGIEHVQGNTVRMSPHRYISLAAPFGHLGGPELDKKKVATLSASSRKWSNPMLSVKQHESGRLQVGLHDGRHRALASAARGNKLIHVDIVRGRKFARENPHVTDEDMARRISSEGLSSEIEQAQDANQSTRIEVFAKDDGPWSKLKALAQDDALGQDADLTPEARQWFHGSKVTDENGNPKVMHHGTLSAHSKFQMPSNDVGIHFGSAEQAHQRINDLKNEGSERGGEPYVHTAYLNAKNPFRMRDSGFNDQDEGMSMMREDLARGYPQDSSKISRLKSPLHVRNYLKGKGHDSVVYKNEIESRNGGDQDSHIVFHPSQIKSTEEATPKSQVASNLTDRGASAGGFHIGQSVHLRSDTGLTDKPKHAGVITELDPSGKFARVSKNGKSSTAFGTHHLMASPAKKSL